MRVEHYLVLHPELAGDARAMLDLIQFEMAHRLESGELDPAARAGVEQAILEVQVAALGMVIDQRNVQIQAPGRHIDKVEVADPLTVRSPTFVLHHVYRGATVPLHHLDLYRLGESADLAFLDVAGLLESGAVVVEWGDHEGLRHLDPVVVRVDVGAGTDRAFDLDAEGAPPRIVDVWRRW